jgi:unsaturated rhamnogalacturonyl hydrolase
LPTEAETLARLRAAAELLTRYRFECWHYGDSVGFEGLLAASDVLGDGRFEGFVHGAIKSWAPRAEPYRELDNTAPGHAMCLCYERTSDVAVLDAASRLAEFLAGRRKLAGVYVSFERAPLRVPYGGDGLSEAEQELLADPGPGVYVDCLHFDGPLFAHLGELTGDRRLVDIAAEQTLATIELLQEGSGIFSHFWLEKTERAYGYGWARGQGWALLGLGDVLEHLPADHAARPAIERAIARLAAALAAAQRPSGHWPTLVHEPETYLETSAALFAATGFARGLARGLLDEELREPCLRAWRAGLGALDADGLVTGVSAIVWSSTSLGHYRAVPQGFMVPWGQGPLLLAAREVGTLDAEGASRGAA